MTRFIGVDLAWAPGTPERPANETGLVLLDRSGRIRAAGWARGLDAVTAKVLEWTASALDDGERVLVGIDAPLVVDNPTGMRQCEREVAQRYMHPWRVGANPSNLGKADLAGVGLRRRLEARGARVLDGLTPLAATDALVGLLEVYPYTTIVGTPELGYDLRPAYKRMPARLPRDVARRARADACDELIRRVTRLAEADPPLDLRSHPATASLVTEPSPLLDRPYKHREDLLDAVIAAWTAALWHTRCDGSVQVLGASARPDADGRRATIIAPCKPEQRRD